MCPGQLFQTNNHWFMQRGLQLISMSVMLEGVRIISIDDNLQEKRLHVHSSDATSDVESKVRILCHFSLFFFLARPTI